MNNKEENTLYLRIIALAMIFVAANQYSSCLGCNERYHQRGSYDKPFYVYPLK